MENEPLKRTGRTTTLVTGGKERTVSYTIIEPNILALPRTTVIITHGFLRAGKHHFGLAELCAERLGSRVVLWEMLPLISLGGTLAAQRANVAALVHLVNLHLDATSEALRGDRRDGLPRDLANDPSTLALVGFSAGGAISIEACIELRRLSSCRPPTLLLLDAVPWPSTLSLASELPVAVCAICSLRAEPSAYNDHGKIGQLLRTVEESDSPPSECVNLQLVGSKHVDFESGLSVDAVSSAPALTDRILGLRSSSSAARKLAHDLTLSFLRTACACNAVGQGGEDRREDALSAEVDEERLRNLAGRQTGTGQKLLVS